VSEWWLPAGTVIAAVALTYFFCVRPMRRGHCATTATGRSSTSAELDRALDQARIHLTRLRTDAHQDAQVHADVPPPTRRIREEEHR
jgi:hypothetical protein